MSVKARPDGYHSITPYLIVTNGAAAIEFYKQAFNAIELFRMDGPDGAIMHAEIRIGDSPLMLAGEFPEMQCYGPEKYGGSPVSLMVYVEDVDTQFSQALAAGATELRPVKDQFYGDRSGTLKDPFGHTWTLATHTEDVPEDQLKQRMATMEPCGS
ncbi:MAG: VOC family protein [Actinomycetota bacterium]